MYQILLMILMLLLSSCGGIAVDGSPDAGTEEQLGTAKQALVAPPISFDSGFGRQGPQNLNRRCIGSRTTGLAAPCRMPVLRRMQFGDPPSHWSQFHIDAYYETVNEIIAMWEPTGWVFYGAWQTLPTPVNYTVRVLLPDTDVAQSSHFVINAEPGGWLAGGGGMNNLSVYSTCTLKNDWMDLWNMTGWTGWNQNTQKQMLKSVYTRALYQCMGLGTHTLGFWGQDSSTLEDWCETMSGSEVCGAALDTSPGSAFWWEGRDIGFQDGVLLNSFSY
jgi:hypothetical protein